MSMHVPATASRLVAALLAVVLTLAGAGRGLAAASDYPAFDAGGHGGSVAASPICHARGGRLPAPQRHDCCDACALCTPAALPGTNAQPALVGFVQTAAQVLGAGPVAIPARPRLPGLARGPPLA